MKPPVTTGPEPAGLVTVLAGAKGDLMSRSGRSDRLIQPGALVLDEPFPVPRPGPGDPVSPNGADPVIETFVIGAAGGLVATGSDAAVATWWRPTAEAMATRVLSLLAELGVAVELPGYLTASVTPIVRVETGPHFDDDQTGPGDGVGVVAIAASHAGPRLATGSIGCEALEPPRPLVADDEAMARFDHDGELLVTGPDRIVVFPRFGQLHAGPRLAGRAPGTGGGPGELRNLLVLRLGTVPGGRPGRRVVERA